MSFNCHQLSFRSTESNLFAGRLGCSGFLYAWESLPDAEEWCKREFGCMRPSNKFRLQLGVRTFACWASWYLRMGSDSHSIRNLDLEFTACTSWSICYFKPTEGNEKKEKKQPTAANLIFAPQRSCQAWKVCRTLKIKEGKNRRKKKRLICEPYLSMEIEI